MKKLTNNELKKVSGGALVTIFLENGNTASVEMENPALQNVAGAFLRVSGTPGSDVNAIVDVTFT